MQSDADKIAQRTNRARAELYALAADIGHERVMDLLREVHAVLQGLKGTAHRPAFGPSRATTVPAAASAERSESIGGTVPRDEPGEGTLRADVLAVLRDAKTALRKGEITKRVRVLRPEAKSASVGSIIWNFVRDGVALKRTVQGREHYAVDQQRLKLLPFSIAPAGTPLPDEEDDSDDT